MTETPTKDEVRKMVHELPGLVQQIDAMFPEGSVIVDRAKVERWRAAAINYAFSLGEIGDDWAGAMKRAGLEPNDDAPLP